jgi:hypothetical protein
MKSKKDTSSISSAHYLECDEIPLYNWEKCTQGQFQFIRLKPSKTFNESDIEAFYTLYDKYLVQFDLSQEFKAYLESQKKLIRLRIVYIETGDETILNDIAVEEHLSNDLNPNKTQGMTISETLIVLSKHMKIWINKKEITLADWRNMLKDYERSNK